MLTIRLSRIGKSNKPMYRLIISEKARDPYGRVLEILGSYNPHSKELDVKKDRVEHWLKMGSGMSNTVNNLLIDKGIIKGEKMKSVKIKKSKQQKMADEAKAKEEAAKPKEEEKSETSVEAPKEEVTAETPTEEAPKE